MSGIKYCVESGDFFSFRFSRKKDPRIAAMSHIYDIMGVTHATLGEEIILKDKYEGGTLHTFQSVDLLEELSHEAIEYRIVAGRIHFTKTPHRRSSKPEAWQSLYRTGVPMFECSPGVWLQESFRENPITQNL